MWKQTYRRQIQCVTRLCRGAQRLPLKSAEQTAERAREEESGLLGRVDLWELLQRSLGTWVQSTLGMTLSCHCQPHSESSKKVADSRYLLSAKVLPLPFTWQSSETSYLILMICSPQGCSIKSVFNEDLKQVFVEDLNSNEDQFYGTPQLWSSTKTSTQS